VPAEALCRASAAIVVEIDEHDPRALFGEPPRRRESDAAHGTRDDRGPALESTLCHVLNPPC